MSASDPTARLVAPSGPQPPDLVAAIAMVPTGLISAAIVIITGLWRNPFEYLATLVTGDFQEVADARDAVDHLASFCTDLGDRMDQDINNLMKEWTGIAADHARAFFEAEASRIKENASTLDTIRAALDEIAYYSKGICDWIVSFCGTLVRGLEILLGLSFYPPAAAAWAGVIIADVIAAAKTLDGWRTKITGSASVIMRFGSVAGQAEALEMSPPTSYNNPVV